MTNLNNREGLFLALGGGAARGFAHLGVIKAIHEAGLPIAAVCGTSMGAVVGAAYALQPNSAQIVDDFIGYIHSDHFDKARYSFIREVKAREKAEKTTNKIKDRLMQSLIIGKSLTTGAFVSFEDFRSEIGALVPNKSFDATKIPFFAVATDLTNTREVVFDRGILRSAVMASAAIPGAFPPIQAKEYIYVDGGWMNQIPVYPLLSFGAPHVLAVDVSDDPPPEINPRRGLSLVNEADRAAKIRLMQLQMSAADVTWQPPIKKLHWAAFTQIEQAVEIGYEYARENMDQAEKLLEKPPVPRWYEPWLNKIPRTPSPEKKLPLPGGFDVRGIWDITPASET